MNVFEIQWDNQRMKAASSTTPTAKVQISAFPARRHANTPTITHCNDDDDGCEWWWINDDDDDDDGEDEDEEQSE